MTAFDIKDHFTILNPRVVHGMEPSILKQTPIFRCLSGLGKRMYLPQGIFYWAQLAKKAVSDDPANAINATIGDATGTELNEYLDIPRDRRITFFLKNITEYLSPDIDASTISSYAPITGLPELRSKWKDWIIEKGDLEGKQDVITLPVVNSGVTNGIFNALRLFLNPGESILLPDKYWENYDTIINLNIGASIATFPSFKDGEFNTSGMVEKIEELARKQGKVIILVNFPNNPTGYIPTKNKMAEISSAIVNAAQKLEKPVVVLVDDAYENFTYDPAADSKSIFSYLLDLDPLVFPIKLDGVSKEFLFYGGRVGFITFGLSRAWDVDLKKVEEELIGKISGCIRGTISNSSHISQKLVLKLMENMALSMENRQKVIDVLADRYRDFKERAKALERPEDGIYFDPYQGGFFAFLNLPELLPAEKVARRLLENKAVGVIPSQKPEIGVNGIRIAYCSMTIPEIDEALTRIAEVIG
jgi:aspartate/methionine/tyrosine aminotransferase